MSNGKLWRQSHTLIVKPAVCVPQEFVAVAAVLVAVVVLEYEVCEIDWDGAGKLGSTIGILVENTELRTGVKLQG